jgi:hypothetical protein
MGNTFTRPPKVLGGNRQAISAKDFNALSRAIEELQNAIPAQPAQQNRPGVKMPPAFWGTVSQVPQSDPPEYQASFTLGYLTYQNAGASESEQGVTGYIVPKIKNEDGELISMDAEAPIVVPSVALPDVVSFVYLRVKTDADGVPKFDNESVTIEAFDEAQESIHHVRPSPSGGEEEGDYYFLLLETESNGATPTPAPRVVRRLTGNREMPNQLIEITNIGGKRELYQGYLPGPDDKHELRTLEQLEGDGEPVLKDLNPGDPEATPPVPAEEEGPTIKFRRIAERATSPQVQVKDGGDVIRIEGNGEFGSYIDAFGGQINYNDGLITGVQGGTFNGWWGTIEWVYEAAGGSEETYLHLRQTFRNGILTKVEYWSGVAPVDAPGTEGSPAIVVYNMTDS